MYVSPKDACHDTTRLDGNCGAISSLTLFAGTPVASGDSDAPLLQGERHVKRTAEQIKGAHIQLNTGEAEPRYIALKGATSRDQSRRCHRVDHQRSKPTGHAPV
jgi:hypothetical protein